MTVEERAISFPVSERLTQEVKGILGEILPEVRPLIAIDTAEIKTTCDLSKRPDYFLERFLSETGQDSPTREVCSVLKTHITTGERLPPEHKDNALGLWEFFSVLSYFIESGKSAVFYPKDVAIFFLGKPAEITSKDVPICSQEVQKWHEIGHLCADQHLSAFDWFDPRVIDELDNYSRKPLVPSLDYADVANLRSLWANELFADAFSLLIAARQGNFDASAEVFEFHAIDYWDKQHKPTNLHEAFDCLIHSHIGGLEKVGVFLGYVQKARWNDAKNEILQGYKNNPFLAKQGAELEAELWIQNIKKTGLHAITNKEAAALTTLLVASYGADHDDIRAAYTVYLSHFSDIEAPAQRPQGQRAKEREIDARLAPYRKSARGLNKRGLDALHA